MHHLLTVLGIETSCDETAVAIVRSDRTILCNLIHSQTLDHQEFGGVVPEIAARSHITHLEPLLRRALAETGLTLDALDAIAVTAGPGLIGGVMVGLMTAKALAAVAEKPLIGVNHLEGHALTARLTDPTLTFPYLLLLVSGGHCQILVVEGVGRYRVLGTTRDDALGEAFDKTAKMLGLGYPGGPAVERAAALGTPRFAFPVPLKGRAGCDFSFSGLKTAVRQQIEAEYPDPSTPLPAPFIHDICASFQHSVGETLRERLGHAIAQCRVSHPELQHLVVAGGVAANQAIRGWLHSMASEAGLHFSVAPMALCTDNAAMIAWAGIERLQHGWHDPLTLEPRARWPLAELMPQQ